MRFRAIQNEIMAMMFRFRMISLDEKIIINVMTRRPKGIVINSFWLTPPSAAKDMLELLVKDKKIGVVRKNTSIKYKVLKDTFLCMTIHAPAFLWCFGC